VVLLDVVRKTTTLAFDDRLRLITIGLVVAGTMVVAVQERSCMSVCASQPMKFQSYVRTPSWMSVLSKS
jgi:hypothetical protein